MSYQNEGYLYLMQGYGQQNSGGFSIQVKKLAATEDAMAVWIIWMYLGYGARDVIVAGDSAGGNLALSFVLKLKEQKRILPRGLILFSPWTDLTGSGNLMRRRGMWIRF